MKKLMFRSSTAALVLFVASCGGASNSVDTTVSSDSSTSTTAAPESEGISIEEAGKNYIAAVTPTNCALTRYSAAEQTYSIGNAQIDPSALDELPGLVGDIASARQTAVENLVKGDWPEAVKEEIDQMAIYWAGLQRSEEALSQVTDLGSWNDAMAQWKNKSSSSDSGLSKIIRIKLSLPNFSPSECS